LTTCWRNLDRMYAGYRRLADVVEPGHISA
jgi:hypothetical protein